MTHSTSSGCPLPFIDEKCRRDLISRPQMEPRGIGKLPDMPGADFVERIGRRLFLDCLNRYAGDVTVKDRSYSPSTRGNLTLVRVLFVAAPPGPVPDHPNKTGAPSISFSGAIPRKR